MGPGDPLPAVIICGLGSVGARVAQSLASDHAVTIVSTGHDERYRPVLSLPNVRLIEGNFLHREVLERAGLSTAKALLALSADDFTNLTAALIARESAPSLPLLVRLVDPQQAAALGRHLPDALGMSVPEVAASVFGLATYRAGHRAGALHIHADDVFLVGDHPWLAAIQRRGTAAPEAQRAGPAATVSSVERERGVVVLAHRPGEGRPLEPLPPPDAELGPSEEILVAGPWERLASQTDGRAAARERRWRRLSGTLAHLVALIRGVRVVLWVLLATLVAVVVLSSAVFRRGLGLSPLDAVYFAVATMAGASYGDISLQHAPAHLKVFGIILMLSSALLLAALFAVVTDYLVGSRLNELLGTRPLPRRGHVIVCGLGTVGLHCAEMLRAIGEAVVVVDSNPRQGEVRHAHARGIPVVTGDAVELDTLERANIGTARCLFAATSDDRTNLTIALAAREAAPRVAIILRLFDDALVKPAQRGLGIDEALSAVEPAAHGICLAVRLGFAYRAVLGERDGTAVHIVDLGPATARANDIEAWLRRQLGGIPFRILARRVAADVSARRGLRSRRRPGASGLPAASVTVATTAAGARRLLETPGEERAAVTAVPSAQEPTTTSAG